MDGERVKGLLRRQVIAGAGAVALSGIPRYGWAAAKVAPITVVISQSPWFDGFRKVVELYEKETGNKVELDVNPFAGSLEKQRNSVRARQGQYDVLIVNSGWMAEMYVGGFIAPVTDIEPSFKLDPAVYTLNDTIFYDASRKAMTKSGKLMGMPVNPNIPMLFYRSDLYKEAGLKVPETFDELRANAKRLHSPPRMYGIVQRGARGPHTVAYDFYPYLFGMGGSIFRDQTSGDYTVTLNGPAGLAALDYYIQLAREAGHPKTASLDQAEVIQNMVTGRAANVMLVIAVWPQMDDPSKSVVVDKVDIAPPPHAPGFPSSPPLGHWIASIAHNVPDDRKRAAVEFMRWFQTKEAQVAHAKAGGIPVNAGAYDNPISEERAYRWMKPMAKALPLAVNIYQFPESTEVIAILELGLNRAIAGETSSVQALNDMAGQIRTVMASRGYNTGAIEPLR